jgi:Dynein heavy chain AAA lid domain
LEEDMNINKRKLVLILAFAFLWGVGGCVEERTLVNFEAVYREIFKTIILPKVDNLFNIYIDTTEEWTFMGLDVTQEEFVFNKDLLFYQIFVPTIETMRF